MYDGILFTNLVDFDMKYGHRNDVLFITADHGCDPTTPGTDHSREYVPLLVYGKGWNHPKSLGIRKSFADLGATVTEILGLKKPRWGQSFYKDIKSDVCRPV